MIARHEMSLVVGEPRMARRCKQRLFFAFAEFGGSRQLVKGDHYAASIFDVASHVNEPAANAVRAIVEIFV